jgi:tetratricopeptide (TPR) repeat protein
MRKFAAPSAQSNVVFHVGACHSTVRRAQPNFRGALHACRVRNTFAVCVFLFSLPACALPAQQSSSSSGATPGWPMHDSAPRHGLPDAVGTAPEKSSQNTGSCLLWTVASAPANTVSTAALQIPGKARAEYEKACGDLRDAKFETAENHLHKAIQFYPKYADAMVLLGQLLAAHNRVDDAVGLCSQAAGVDPDFVPAYLCLADTSGQLRHWDQTQEFADHALKLNPMQNCYGHFYLAVAQFHLSQFSGAEKNALQTIDDDHQHRLPQAHLLLAQIYGNRNDLKNVASQLRAYLQVAPKSPDAPNVRKRLEDIESQVPR